jgi:hypothetical protein
VRPDLLRARHALLNRDRERDVQLRGDRFGLRHHLSNDFRHFRMAHQIFERPTGQRADRVEGDVAEQLHPDFVPEPGRHRRAQASRDQRFGERPGALGPEPARFAQAQAIPFGVVNHSRLRDVCREISQRADDALRLDRLRDHAARIHSLEMQTVQFAWVMLKVPPRDAVLRADHDRVRSQQWPELGRKSRQTVRLHAEHHDVRMADRVQVADNFRFDFEVAVRADDAESFLLHRAQVRATGEQHDICTRFREARADVSANGAGPRNRNPHEAFWAYAFATTPRWILPVAVRGMASVM